MNGFSHRILFWLAIGGASSLGFGVSVAQAQRDRVMGMAGEGSQHRIRYLSELGRKAVEREHCRLLVDRFIFPELSKYADLGLGRSDGPPRALLEKAELKRSLEKSDAYRTELLRLARALNSENTTQKKQTRAQILRKVEGLMRAYRNHSQKSHGFAAESLRKREVAALKFQIFAQAVLSVRRSPECQSVWKSLKVHIPLRLGHRVIQERRNAAAVLITIQKKNSYFKELLANTWPLGEEQRIVADSVESRSVQKN